MTRLSPESLQSLFEMATALNLDRDALLGGVNRSFVAQLASAPSSGSRVLADLHEMNMVELLTDGSDPLRQWLMNAVALSQPRPEANVFRACIPLLSAVSPPPSAPRPHGARPSQPGPAQPAPRRGGAPRVVLFPSYDTVDVCRAVQASLSDEFLVELDHERPARAHGAHAGSILAELARQDFAVFVPGGSARAAGAPGVHDALVFTIGIAMGALGPDRVFLLQDRAHPATLAQLTNAVTVAYALPHDPRDEVALGAAVSTACFELRSALRRARPRVSLVSCADEREQLCVLADHPLSDRLRGIINNTRRAMLVDHAAFRSEVEFRLDRWRADTSAWSHGTFIVGENYRTFLKAVYAQARRSVFATSVAEYRHVWTSALGRELLAAHRSNTAAKVVRVFVFDRRSDVLDEDHLIFAEQQAAGVEVLLYFDLEDDLFLFPSDLGNDWTLVDDGRVIGVTRQMGESLEAKWYFDDDDQSGQFRGYMRRLVERCEPYVGRPAGER